MCAELDARKIIGKIRLRCRGCVHLLEEKMWKREPQILPQVQKLREAAIKY
jgi:hypothetical protein